jgi:hypothetical protein
MGVNGKRPNLDLSINESGNQQFDTMTQPPSNTIKLRLTKTDVARRQIETAIRLWFASEEPVSIHTLAAAAHQVLHDLGKMQRSPTILRDLSCVREEDRKPLRKSLLSAENFFKHAETDSGETLNFNPEITPIFIFDAVCVYDALVRQSTPILITFKTWVFIHHPNAVNMKKEDRELANQLLKRGETDFARLPKAEFLRCVLPLFTPRT